jgi:putative DNA primase/helicase
MLKLARSNPRIVIKAELLDCDPFLLNAANGTLDLRTGEQHNHRRQDLLTHCLPIAYNPNANCPRWYDFLARVLRVEFEGRVDDVATRNLIAFVKRAAGYTLTGSTREHVLFELYGVGANGKSVFLGVLKSILGRSLARTLPFTALLAQRNPSNDGSGPSDHIARLRGARMVESVEANEGLQFNEAMLKSLTGGDRVAARHLYRGGIEFDPQFKLWIATNHKPRIVGTDVGIWRRVRMIPFTQVIPEEERNPNLKEELIANEAEGILRWAVEGCKEWQRDGLGDSEAVVLATAEYRREQDVLGQFLDERCSLEPAFKVRTVDLVAAFNAWARENHEDELSAKALADRLAERRAPVKRMKVGGKRGWSGIGLRGGEDGRWND